MTHQHLHYHVSTIADIKDSVQETRLNHEGNWLFPAVRIERRWHPAGFQTCSKLSNLWEAMSDKQRQEFLWERHKKHHDRVKPPYSLIKKSEFLKIISCGK